MQHPHHATIRALIAEVRNLNDSLDVQHDLATAEAERGAERRTERERLHRQEIYEAQDRARQAESDRYQHDQYLADLDRAQRRGDGIGEREAKRKLGMRIW